MLVVVESPNKVKKIQEYLTLDYEVISSVGHIRDLSKKHKGSLPEEWDIIKDKQRVLHKMKKAYERHHKQIIIATDPDREGEAIAWHICHLLEIDPETAMRCRFNEITEASIKSAIKRAEDGIDKLDINLVNSQRARRLLDRRLGYSSTMYLWKVVGGGVSAGRCLVPAAKLLKQHMESNDYNKYKYILRGKLDTDIGIFTLTKDITTDVTYDIDIPENNRLNFLSLLYKRNPSQLIIHKITKTKIRKSPPKPLSTSDILTKFGGSPTVIMGKLQLLFEKGYITYHRTDSHELSSDFVNSVLKSGTYDMYNTTSTKTPVLSDDSVKHAHEAIRPTNWSRSSVPDGNVSALYTFIRNHSVGSLFPEWVGEQMSIYCNNNWKITFERTLQNDEGGHNGGWLGVINKAPLCDFDKTILDLKEGDLINVTGGNIRICKESECSHITESSMIRLLEKENIGRPSTYSTIVNHLLKRGYAKPIESSNSQICSFDLSTQSFKVSNDETTNMITDEEGISYNVSKYIKLTQVGIKCIDMLDKSKYNPLFEISFTAEMEKVLDEISVGEHKWEDYINGIDKQIKDVEYDNNKILLKTKSEPVINTRDKSVSFGDDTLQSDKKGAFPDTVLGEYEGYCYGKGRTRYGPVIWRELGNGIVKVPFQKREYKKITAKQWYMIKLPYAIKSFQAS